MIKTNISEITKGAGDLAVDNHGLKKIPLIIFIPGLFAAAAAGYYIGGALGEGKTVFDFYYAMEKIMNNPCKNYFNGKYTIIAVAAVISAYLLCVLYFMLPGKNYMPGKEYGDAHYADNGYVNKCLSKPLDLKNPESYEKVKKVRKKRWWNRRM